MENARKTINIRNYKTYSRSDSFECHWVRVLTQILPVCASWLWTNLTKPWQLAMTKQHIDNNGLNAIRCPVIYIYTCGIKSFSTTISATGFLVEPRQYHNARYLDFLPKVNHPDRPIHVEVIKHRATVESHRHQAAVTPCRRWPGSGLYRCPGYSSCSIRRQVAIDSTRGVAMQPLVAYVTLQLPSVVDPRFFTVRQVFN